MRAGAGAIWHPRQLGRCGWEFRGAGLLLAADVGRGDRRAADEASWRTHELTTADLTDVGG